MPVQGKLVIVPEVVMSEFMSGNGLQFLGIELAEGRFGDQDEGTCMKSDRGLKRVDDLDFHESVPAMVLKDRRKR